MRATYLILFFSLAVTCSYAQEPADALRYSYLNQPGGTARNQAIGGAGGSLGGEFTSLFINPAGLGFYNTGDFVFTPQFSMKTSNSTYLNSTGKATNNNFNLGTTGFVISSPSRKQGGVKNFSIGLGINRIADFNNYVYYKGKNSNSSYSEKYLEELIANNATNPDSAAFMFPETSSLAINTYLVNPSFDSSGNLQGYGTKANPSTGLTQENTINTTGGITDFSVGAGMNLKNKFYFGGTLSFPFLRYNRNGFYKESDASGKPNNDFNYFEANETLSTRGIGVNGKFGLIYKPEENVRLGLAFHTPTYYQITDEYTSEVVTDLEGYGGAGVKFQRNTDLTNGQPLESKYNMTTPLKLIVSGSYLFAADIANVQSQHGFITADVEYINYKGMSFHDMNNDAGAKDYYNSLNKIIDQLYKNALNVRIGGEMKFNTFMVRLGGAYYGNPYQNQTSDIVKVSGGVGYRNRGLFMDLTYVYSMMKNVHYPYLLQDKPNSPAFLKNNAGNIVATIGFKF
ncbi:MAG: aromatic hydrocarbon degradation protein [Ginsengibacter sp.]